MQPGCWSGRFKTRVLQVRITDWQEKLVQTNIFHLLTITENPLFSSCQYDEVTYDESHVMIPLSWRSLSCSQSQTTLIYKHSLGLLFTKVQHACNNDQEMHLRNNSLVFLPSNIMHWWKVKSWGWKRVAGNSAGVSVGAVAVHRGVLLIIKKFSFFNS